MPDSIDPLAIRPPGAFLDRSGRLPNNPVVATALEAIFNGGPSARQLMGGWYETDDGLPAYSRLGRRGGRITIRIGAAFGESEHAQPGKEEQWRVVEGMSVLTLDTALTILAQLCDARLGGKTLHPRPSPLGISTASVLRYKGYRRWGREREEFSARIAAEVECLSRLRIDVSGFPAWDPDIGRWNPRGVSMANDRLIDVLAPGPGKARFPGGPGATENIPWAKRVWSMQVGDWGRCWLNSQGKMWTTDLPLALVELDHRSNRASQMLAKKIGLNAVQLFGMAKARPIVVRRIDRLLENIGELPRFEFRGGHWAGRIRDRFEDALLLLEEAGLVGGVEWLDDAAPGVADRHKGWVDRWLAAKVKIVRPALAGAEARNVLLFDAPATEAAVSGLSHRGTRPAVARTPSPLSLVATR